MMILLFGGYVVTELWHSFIEAPTRMTIDVPLSVNRIPFPAVTMCHPQTVLEYKEIEFINSM